MSTSRRLIRGSSLPTLRTYPLSPGRRLPNVFRMASVPSKNNASAPIGCGSVTVSERCQGEDFPVFIAGEGVGKAITLYPEEISEFLKRGGTLAWGIVPNSSLIEGETPETLADILMGYIDDLVGKGVDRGLLVRQSMLTPQCGLGGADEGLLDTVFDLLQGLSREMKKRCGL